MNVGYYTGADALTFADECSAIHRSAFSVSGMRGWTSEEIGALLQRESTFLLKTSYGFLLADLLVDEVEILTIAVSPDYQGQKLGRALMTKLDDFGTYRKVIKASLEVALDNFSAISMYKAFNFQKIAIRERYFKKENGSVDALMMSKIY